MVAATEYVILVDEHDKAIGIEEKIKAHEQGLCHRAFSVCIYREKEGHVELLLQQRAAQKYHGAGLWTNTCCSHPRPDESILEAATRRLWEEMGIKIPLKPVGKCHYIANFDNGLIENEIDHVLIGEWYQHDIRLDAREVQDYRWVPLDSLKQDLAQYPEIYSPWLSKVLTLFEADVLISM